METTENKPRKWGSTLGECPRCGKESSLGWKTGLCRDCYIKSTKDWYVPSKEKIEIKLKPGQHECPKCRRAHYNKHPLNWCIDEVVREKRRLYEGIFAQG